MSEPVLANLAVHTVTLKQWDLPTCLDKLASAGVGGVCVWRQAFEGVGLDAAARVVRDSGLRVPSLVRGGFFVSDTDQGRLAAIDENRRCLDEAEAIGAEMVVLVCGAVPGVPLDAARGQTADALEALLPHAEQTGVKLAIEPLHPQYAADRSCVVRITDARRICEKLRHPLVGVAVDAYHVWWDSDLESEISNLKFQNALFGYHVCDWKIEQSDPLNDRGLMGEGVIDLKGMGRLVREVGGFGGMDECEIFSAHHWQRDGDEWLSAVIGAYRTHC